MSSRPTLGPSKIVTNGNMSADIVSPPTITTLLSMVSYDISWAGTAPVGTITVEVSNSYSQNFDGSVRNPGTWNTVTLSDDADVSGGTGSGFVNIAGTAGYAIRLRYTATSGTGLMQVIVSGKVA